MARLRNVNTGALVSVRDEKAPRMGSEWVAAESPTPAPAKRAPRKRTAKKPAASEE